MEAIDPRISRLLRGDSNADSSDHSGSVAGFPGRDGSIAGDAQEGFDGNYCGTGDDGEGGSHGS